MRKAWVLAGAAALVAATATGAVVAVSGAEEATPAAPEEPAATGTVVRGTLSAMVSLAGTLTYRARPDGSPYPVINQARGTYTALPSGGDRVGCGDVLYRVDDIPVLLLCGTVPAYRDLHTGAVGNDVRRLNEQLHRLGHDAGAAVDPDGNEFTWRTQQALEALQRDKGLAVTGALAIDDAVFLPEPIRIADVKGEPGGSALPGTAVLFATSDAPGVQVELAASQQGEVQEGDRARITLPGNRSATGRVDRQAAVARVATAPNGDAGEATFPAFIALDDPEQARGIDQAPVRVEITTAGVESALSVPVTALVGKSGGGFAVEVVRDDGRRELVAVKPGLLDTTAGRVQVDGDVVEGDRVVVPSP